MQLIDTHAHLDDRRLREDIPALLRRAKDVGVVGLITIGADEESSKNALDIARKYKNMWAAVGVHPHDAKSVDEGTMKRLEKLACDKNVVAIGEIGLDYHYDNSPRDVQKRVFREQMRLAHRVSLPVVIHDRDSHGDVMDILRQEKVKDVGGVLHCFSGSIEMARQCVQMGLYISIAGPVTFNNARKLQEVATNIPIDRLLIETDCPYLTPVPNRGKCNEPSYVRYTAEKIASLRGISLEELAQATTENAKRCFALPDIV